MLPLTKVVSSFLHSLAECFENHIDKMIHTSIADIFFTLKSMQEFEVRLRTNVSMSRNSYQAVEKILFINFITKLLIDKYNLASHSFQRHAQLTDLITFTFHLNEQAHVKTEDQNTH